MSGAGEQGKIKRHYEEERFIVWAPLGELAVLSKCVMTTAVKNITFTEDKDAVRDAMADLEDLKRGKDNG